MNIKKFYLTITLAICLVVFVGCGEKSSVDNNDENGTTIEVAETLAENENPYIVEPALLSISGENLDIKVPNNIMETDGPFAEKNKIKFSNESKSADVIITADKAKDGYVCSYGWSIQINDASAGNEFEYCFDDKEDYKIVNAENYEKSEEGAGLYFLDSEGYEITVISEAAAHDANGKEVESYYKVDGNKVIQVVSFDNTNKFPITIE